MGDKEKPKTVQLSAVSLYTNAGASKQSKNTQPSFGEAKLYSALQPVTPSLIETRKRWDETQTQLRAYPTWGRLGMVFGSSAVAVVLSYAVTRRITRAALYAPFGTGASVLYLFPDAPKEFVAESKRFGSWVMQADLNKGAERMRVGSFATPVLNKVFGENEKMSKEQKVEVEKSILTAIENRNTEKKPVKEQLSADVESKENTMVEDGDTSLDDLYTTRSNVR